MITLVAVTLPSGLLVPTIVTVAPLAISVIAFVADVTSVTVVVGVSSTIRCAPAAGGDRHLVGGDRADRAGGAAAEGGPATTARPARGSWAEPLAIEALAVESGDGRRLRRDGVCDPEPGAERDDGKGQRRDDRQVSIPGLAVGPAPPASRRDRTVRVVRTVLSSRDLQEDDPGPGSGRWCRSTRCGARRSAEGRRPGAPGKGRRRGPRRRSRRRRARATLG